jgi:hypothetical protein
MYPQQTATLPPTNNTCHSSFSFVSCPYMYTLGNVPSSTSLQLRPVLPSGAPGSHSAVPCMPKCTSACARYVCTCRDQGWPRERREDGEKPWEVVSGACVEACSCTSAHTPPHLALDAPAPPPTHTCASQRYAATYCGWGVRSCVQTGVDSFRRGDSTDSMDSRYCKNR